MWWRELLTWIVGFQSFCVRLCSWAPKFSGVFASRSLEVQVFLTKWLLIVEPGTWISAFSAAFDKNIPISFFPNGALMCYTLFVVWLQGKIEHKGGSFWLVWSVAFEELIEFHRTYLCARLVGLTCWKTSPHYPTAGLVTQFHVADSSKWQRAVLNFGPLWRGISVGSDAL